jgi:CDP-diacylglycerol--serine O-phosphatidyltransferase
LKQIPNIFTLLNLFFGCLAIVFALQTESVNIYQSEDLTTSFSMPEKLVFSSLCIGIAAVIDFLDGFVARLLKAGSELGKQLDSLSDIVSFGAAPSMILYQFLRLSFIQQEDVFSLGIGWLLPAFVFACAGAYRLGRFNLEEPGKPGFTGVPIPAAGLVVASLPLIAYYNYFSGSVNGLLFNSWFLYAVIIILSLLMVSRMPMLSLKFSNYTIKGNIPKVILMVIAVLAALFLQWLAVPVVFICYIALSLALKNKSV